MAPSAYASDSLPVGLGRSTAHSRTAATQTGY